MAGGGWCCRSLSKMNTRVNPADIKPLHTVRNPALVDRLAADMTENGWQGRPLLAIQGKLGYVAWTGSHRIAAAIKAGLQDVPCYVIDETLLLQHGEDSKSGVMDYERLAIIRKIGDDTATHLMWLEGRD
jgi:ParB-like chromosome segregation protein Spo0J